MKKIFLILILSLIALTSFGQTKLKRGLSVGNDKAGSNVVVIDSIITTASGEIVAFSGGDSLRYRILYADRANLWDVIDTVTTTATKYDTQNLQDSLDAYLVSGVDATRYFATKTIKRTIGWDGATGTDFVWTSAAGHVAQNLDLGAIIPAQSRVIGIEIVCTEALVGCTDMTFRAGNASAGEQFIVSLSCDALNEVVGIITPTLPAAVIMNWASATNIWIGGDPTDNNWSDMTAGKWTVYVTFINYTDI